MRDPIAADPSNECHKFPSNCHAKDEAASAIRIMRINRASIAACSRAIFETNKMLVSVCG